MPHGLHVTLCPGWQDAMMRATPTGVLNRNLRAAMHRKRLEAKRRKAA